MTVDSQLGRCRLYACSAAVTCIACGMPFFFEREGMHLLPEGPRVKCPVCGVYMLAQLSLRKEECR